MFTNKGVVTQITEYSHMEYIGKQEVDVYIGSGKIPKIDC